MEPRSIAVSDVVFRQDLYPRIDTSPQTVQKYAEDLSVLPPIEVNQHTILIDGWHRWTAHRKERAETIPCIITETVSEAQLFQLAVERNATHGVQLSRDDKVRYAKKMLDGVSLSDWSSRCEQVARVVSASPATVKRWVSRQKKDQEAERKKKAAELWLACYTQDEIAAAAGMPRKSAGDLFKNLGETEQLSNFAQIFRAQPHHEADPNFVQPLYNVWKLQHSTNRAKHFGQSEATWLDNLLYLYTEPLDVVFDPFAGGGSTIDVCKRRLRRYYVSDLTPIPEREHEIRLHDITTGLPKVPRWNEVKLVYLDPPYWKQAEGQYSDRPEDLANMSFDRFQETLGDLVSDLASRLQSGAHIALIIQPTQWNTDAEHTFMDHVADLFRRVSLPVSQRIQVPYESQQCTPQMVEWAKAHRQCLVLSREIVVWEVR